MAGRGKGRGKASMSFDVSRLGFGAGEGLPKASVQPPPLYPPSQQRPTPLFCSEVDEYLLALSQEYRGSIRDSPFYLKPKTVKRDIIRYTDRYKQNQIKGDSSEVWEPDWSFIPKELKPTKERKVSKRTGAKPNVSNSQSKSSPEISDKDVLKKLEVLEKTAVKGDKVADDKEEEDVVVEDEEELEEDNDYNFDYYNDGGDKYGDDDEGDGEGPVY